MQCVQCDRCGKWRELANVEWFCELDEWFCELNADQKYKSCEVAEQEWKEGEGEPTQPPTTLSIPAEEPAIAVDPGALAAEVQRRGLVRRDNSFTSRHKDVIWHKKAKKWKAQIDHGGKRNFLGYFAIEEEAKACYDARCLALGIDLVAGTSSGLRGVTWHKTNRKWTAQIMVDGKSQSLGYFEATARGEADAALAYDAAARAAGRPEKANFELTFGFETEQSPTTVTAGHHDLVRCVQCDRCGKWRELADVNTLPDEWFCELNADRTYSSCEVAEQDWSEADNKGEERAASADTSTSDDAREMTLAAEVDKRGLVWRKTCFTSRQNGVSWHKRSKKSPFRGVYWNKNSSRWQASITIGGKTKSLGTHAASPSGEVDAALAYDAAARAVGQPEKANFKQADVEPEAEGDDDDEELEVFPPFHWAEDPPLLAQDVHSADLQQHDDDYDAEESNDEGDAVGAGDGAWRDLTDAASKTQVSSWEPIMDNHALGQLPPRSLDMHCLWEHHL
jgi:hypothetical protein